MAHVAGSGTAAATGEMVSCPLPKNGLITVKLPVRKVGEAGGPVNSVGALNCVKPRLAALMLRLENTPLPKLMVDAVPATPPNDPATLLNENCSDPIKVCEKSGVGLESSWKTAVPEGPEKSNSSGAANAGEAATIMAIAVPNASFFILSPCLSGPNMTAEIADGGTLAGSIKIAAISNETVRQPPFVHGKDLSA